MCYNKGLAGIKKKKKKEEPTADIIAVLIFGWPCIIV